VTPGPVYIHIGPPKSGTTYLQRLLMDNRRALARDGFNYPTIGEADHFLAALDAVGRTSFLGADLPRRKGAWAALAAELLAHDEPGLFSHEILAAVGPGAADRVRRDLSGREVHIVATVRDPARQVLADWQEQIKIRRTATFEQYVASAKLARDLDAPDKVKARPFLGQHVLRALRIWSRSLPPEHVHVVTVPPAGSDPLLLWLRFAEAVGIAEPRRYRAPDGGGTNRRLGAASTELLRRVNIALDGSMSGRSYNTIVKGTFAQQILPRVSSTRPAALPEAWHERMRELAEHWRAGIREAGYQVHGDLADLTPVFADGPAPSDPDVEAVVDEAVESIAALLKIVHDQSGIGGRIADPADLDTVRSHKLDPEHLERAVRIAVVRLSAWARRAVRRETPPAR